MATLYHKEEHFRAPDSVRDVVLGMADGLTVPFALAAGISGAISAAHVVVTAGVAEIAAGSIAMGLGGYLAARSEAEHYASERRREEMEIVEKPEFESQEVAEVFEGYGLVPQEYGPVIVGLRRRPKAWRDFMMRFELGLEEPDPRRAIRSALTIALSYVAGGIIPLAPYVALGDVRAALPWSVGLTLTALLLFGFIKGHFTGVSRTRSAVETALVGGIAAAVAYALASWIG
ncbi:MAG: VIT1/CCC1 transporter family protein [Chromatiales bacterium]